MNLIEVFKALGDENRIRILNLLAKQDLCVCEIETILDMTQSNTSRHLIKLKNAGIITCEKKSQWVVYKINPEFVEGYRSLYSFVIEEVSKIKQLAVDGEKLQRYKCSSFTCENIKDNKEEVIRCLEGLK